MADYIAKDDEGFDNFQSNFIMVIKPLAVTLGIPVDAMTALVAYQSKWIVAFAVGGKAHKITREMPDTKDKTVAREAYEHSKSPQPLGLRAFIAAYVTYNPLVSDTLRVTLGLPIHKTSKTTHKVATKNFVSFRSFGIGGGVVETQCHSSGSRFANPTATTAKTGKKTARARKEAGYDVMKYWLIIKQGDALPKTANDAGITQTLFTKAKIIHQLGQQNIGLILCEFLQWYNSKHPELAGPISNLQTTIIT